MAELAKYKVKLLDEFEQRTDSWSFGHFEQRLKELKKDSYYQDAKGIITDAHKAGKWEKTVKRYALSNYIAFGNSSLSFFNEIWLKLSDEEKKELEENK